MTRAQAAVTLRDLVGDDEGSEYARALRVAIRALEPAKPRKPKVSPNLKAFLAIRFPQPNVYEGPPGAREVEARMSPEAKSQFRYGTNGHKHLNGAVLLAAKEA